MNKQIPQHVLQFTTHHSPMRRRFAALIRSNRFALAGSITLAIFIPEYFHPYFSHEYSWAHLIRPEEPTFYAAIFALFAAHISLRKVGSLPLVDDKVLVLPTFLIIYAATAFILTLALHNFGRYHFRTSAAIGVSWYFFLAVARGRMSSPLLAFFGQMRHDEELLTARVEWVVLHEPILPRDVLAIVFDSEQEQSPTWERFLSRAVLRNIPVYDIDHLREMILGRVRLRSRPELVFGQLFPSQPYLRLKRLIDTLAVIPALVLAVPVMLVAGLVIRIESPGPVIYRQQRVGFHGRRFSCYKLRTMWTDIGGLAYTGENDPRITKVGRYLRRWRIDELPQLFNILKGEMSWIGPRPEAVSLVRNYQRDIPFYPYRHSVRPGITGWAAVHQGNVALTDAVTRKLEYDFYYIKYFSIWLDFLIVLMTIRTLVTGFGSR